MSSRVVSIRKAKNTIAFALFAFFGVVCSGALLSIIWSIVARSFQGLSWGIFVKDYIPTIIDPTGGGLRHAIVGEFLLVGGAAMIGIPVGIAAGIYLAEYGRKGNLAKVIETANDLKLGLPSIIVGIFAYTVAVRPVHSFNGWAGSLALALLLIPVVLKVTAEMLRQIPDTLREAAFALGAPPMRVILDVTLKAAAGGIITGVILALARIAGETAPLLFTALGGKRLTYNMNESMPSLPVTIYEYAGSSENSFKEIAWTGSLLLTLFILTITIVIKVIQQRKAK